MNTMPSVDLKVALPVSPVSRDSVKSMSAGETSFSNVLADAMQSSEVAEERAQTSESTAEKAPVEEKPNQQKARVRRETREQKDVSKDETGQNVPAEAAANAANIAVVTPVLLDQGPLVVTPPVDAADEAVQAVALRMQSVMPAATGNQAAGKIQMLPGVPGGQKIAQNMLAVQSDSLEPGGMQVAAQLQTVAPTSAMLTAENSAPLLAEQVVSAAGVRAVEPAAMPAGTLAKVADAGLASGKIAGSNLTVEASVVPAVAIDSSAAPRMTIEAVVDAPDNKLTFGEQGLMNLFGVADTGDAQPPVAQPVLDMAAQSVLNDVLGAEPARDQAPVAGGGAMNEMDSPLFLSMSQQPVVGFATTPNAVVQNAPPAPTMVVPAAQVTNEIVKFAGAGGGRAVMEITSPDLGALKIDLSIDGRGSARLIVEATTHAARDQLEQGLRKLNDEFAGMGLSLNVDLRQGGSGAQERSFAWQQSGLNVPSMGESGVRVSERLTPSSRVLRDNRDDSQVNFYA